MNKKEYKNVVKGMLESTGKSFNEMNQKEKNSLFENSDFYYKMISKSSLNESIIDDQPDSMINNQETSIAKTMDSGELNSTGQVIASTGGVKESSFDSHHVTSREELQTVEDAKKFKEMLKTKYGVDSVSELSYKERQEIMKSMNFDDNKDGGEEKINKDDIDFGTFKSSEENRASYAKRDMERLEFLSQYDDSIKSLDDFYKLGQEFKTKTGEKMHHPMAILASIQILPSDSSLKSKLKNVEKVLQSNVSETINEDRKTSSMLNVEKLGKENLKNFNSDVKKEDSLNQNKTYPKDDAMHKSPIYPLEKDFYIEQDLDKVQREAKSMADLEKEALAKIDKNNGLKNVGNSANEKGNEIPKRNLSKEEMVTLAMNRGDGMQDIVYDNKPSEKFEKRMEKDLGEDIYKSRNDKMEFKAKGPMYNKEIQPVDAGSEKDEEKNKFKKGFNESLNGKYTNEFNKIKLIEFKLSDVEIVDKMNEEAFKLSLDGMGNKYSILGKKINENVDFNDITNKYNFYVNENKVFAIEKTKDVTPKNETKEENKNLNESFDKMKRLMKYDPTNYVNTKKSVKY